MISKNIFLYAAYASTCLEDRAWSFFSTIVMEILGGMYFVSISQFSESLLQMICGGALGQFIDRISRRNAIIIVILLNNFSILFSAIFLMMEFKSKCTGDTCKLPDLHPLKLYMSIFLCAVNRLFLNAEKSIIARDWVVAINEKNCLARQNATLTGFDQLLNVLSPIVVGTLITSRGIFDVLTLFCVFSIISLASKSIFLYLTYTSNSSLHNRSQFSYKILNDEESLLPQAASIPVSRRGVFSTYWHQSTFCAAFGMALFYKTVMGFDNLAVGYATVSSSLSIFTIGALKSYGAVAGMAGVISYAFLEKRYGLLNAGYVGLVVQQIFSLLALQTIWMPGSPMDFWETGAIREGPSVLIFLIAIATSRFGLWCLDMAVTHSMQIHVPESERNTVFGFHMALCQTFSVPKEILVIVFPQSSHFYLDFCEFIVPKMNIVRIANNAYSCAKLAKNVGGTAVSLARLVSTDETPKQNEQVLVKIVEVEVPCEHKRSYRRLLTDIGVLQTMLERIAQSKNEELISEIKKHRIPQRIEELTVIVAKYNPHGFHELCDWEIKQLDAVLKEIECIYKHTKALMLTTLLLQPAVMRL
ncbi:unnamed protein product [Caenorhabditis brenneri]